MSWNNRFRRAVGKLTAMKAYAGQVGRQWVLDAAEAFSAIVR